MAWQGNVAAMPVQMQMYYTGFSLITEILAYSVIKIHRKLHIFMIYIGITFYAKYIKSRLILSTLLIIETVLFQDLHLNKAK